MVRQKVLQPDGSKVTQTVEVTADGIKYIDTEQTDKYRMAIIAFTFLLDLLVLLRY